MTTGKKGNVAAGLKAKAARTISAKSMDASSFSAKSGRSQREMVDTAFRVATKRTGTFAGKHAK